MAVLDVIDLNESGKEFSQSGEGCSTDSSDVFSSPAVPLADWYDSTKQKGKKPKLAAPPSLPSTLIVTLRLLQSCPLCADEFSTLHVNEQGIVEQVVKRRQAKKKAVKPKTVNGPAKLSHLALCAYRADVDEAVVVELVQREQVLIDKERRKAYIEEQEQQDTWRTIVGEAPPCSQLQTYVHRQREQGRHDYYIDKHVREALAQQRKGVSPTKKATASKSTKGSGKAKSPGKPSLAIRSRIGHRGGIDRATTTINAPRRRCANVKQQCHLFFGSDSGRRRAKLRSTIDDALDVYDWADTTSMLPFERITPSQMFSDRQRGLGCGACNISRERMFTPRSKTGTDTEGRLSMGMMLATGIVKEVISREQKGEI